MSQVQVTRCDECGRIQSEANHWVRIQVWFQEGICVGVVVLKERLSLVETGEYRDLCGQGCAVKHIAKLMNWTVPNRSSE